MTGKEFANIEAETTLNHSFVDGLTQLSNIENPIPLIPKKINRLEVRKQLLNSGIRVDLIENSPELRTAIKNPDFGYADQGKGPAVLTASGNLDNFNKFYDWAFWESKNQPLPVSGLESGKCYGLLQFFGETIALASGQMTPEEYCQKINWRVGKKYQEDSNISKQFNLPTDRKGLQELRETSSIPKGSAIKAFEFILSLNK